MANEVKIILTAVDNASKTLNTTGDSFKGMAKQFLTFGAAAAVAGAGINAIKQSLDSTMSYAKDVRDLSRAIGSSASETSKLIQIADDVEISTETLKMAFKTAIKQGIQPNIAGLKTLAKEYQALDTPLEKSQFAIEKFGRAGLEMNKILELSPEKIDEMARSAEAAGLVMDEAMIAKTEEYRIAMDNMNDSIMGLKISLGTALLPTLTDTVTGLTDNTSAMLIMNKAYKDGDITLGEYLKTFMTTDEYAIANAEAIEELTKKSRAQEAQEQSWLTIEQAMTGAIQNTTEAADEMEQEVSALTEATKKFGSELMFAKAAANLTEDQAIKLGVEMGVLDSKTLLANAAMKNLTAQLNSGKINAAAYAAATQRLYDIINRLPSKKTVEIEYKIIQKGGKNIPQQTGGPVAAGQVYLVGERGPELFVPGAGGHIVPNNQINIYGGVNMNMRGGTGKAAFNEFMAELAKQTRGAANSRAQSIGA